MPVMHAMLGNAAVAAVLCLLALVVGRICRSPAVRHILWVLVLLKLITPPLFRVPLAVLPPEPLSSEFRVLSSESQQLAFSTQNSKLRTQNSAPRIERAPAWWKQCRVVGIDHWMFAVWIAGAAGWFLWQGRRIVRFRRWVARVEDAGQEVVAAALCIAKALGAGCPPAVKAATGIGSPMLWGWGRGTVILFPRELLARLAPEARDTLLAHELAHFLRRDHWVRVLEFVATGLYWWHPAVWLARSRIEAAEEECCDAWVVGGLAASPRRYAEALLATIDFIAELRQPCLPLGACPANRGAQLLHRRLAGIVHARRPSRLRGAAVIRTAAVAVLMIQPVLQAAPRSVPSSEFQVLSPNTHSELTTQNPEPRTQNSKLRTRKSAEPPAWATAPAPDGAVTALARDNEVVLRRPDGKVTALGPGKPLALTFAPNSQRLATAGPGPLVRTWDYEGNLLTEARVSAAARGIAYTPDGRRLLVLDAAGGISARDPDSLALVAEWSVEGPANSIACGPDSQTVVVAFGSWLDAETGWVECWSITEQRKLASYSASAPVGAARFGPDGRTLVVGGWNGLLTWRTLPGGELIAERQLPKGLVAAAAFSPDAGTLPLDPPLEPAPPPVEPAPRPRGTSRRIGCPPHRRRHRSCFRASAVSPNREPRCRTGGPIMGFLGLILLLAAAGPDDSLAKKMLPIYRKEVETYSLAIESAPDRPLELKKEPVFEWSNPGRGRGNTQGVVFLWLRDGRPAALGNIFSHPHAKLPGRQIRHELHALDPEKLLVKRDGYNQWKPQAGMARKELPDAGVPATTRRARLVQMRRLAQEFTGYSLDYEGKRWQLRLLPTPLYRYPTAKTGVVDGALFALVSSAGTDPEVLLLIEAKKEGEKLRWEYACGRFSDWELSVQRKDKEVFASVRSEENPSSHDPLHLYRIYPEKVVTPEGKLLARTRQTPKGAIVIPVEGK